MHKRNRKIIAAAFLILFSAALCPWTRAQQTPVKSAPTPSHSQSRGSISNRATRFPLVGNGSESKELSLTAQDELQFNDALQADFEGDVRTALASWAMLIKKYPDCLSFKLGRIQALYKQNSLQEEEASELEVLLKKLEESNQRHALPYFMLLDAYMGTGKFPQAKSLASRLITLFPHRGDLLVAIRRKTARLRDQELGAQLQKAMHELQLHDVNKAAQLVTIKPSEPSVIASGKVLEIVVSTNCLPRFRLHIAPDRVNGDSGVLRYVISAPKYETISLIDDDSKNFLTLTLDKLLQDHCGSSEHCPPYSSITKTGSTKLGGYDCDIYKCQVADETAYDLLYLSRSVHLEPALAQAISRMCFAPPLSSLPLKMDSYSCGERLSHIQVTRFGQAKFNPAEMAIPAGYHQVKSMMELQLAGDGALKQSDVDDLFSTGKKSWDKPAK